MNEPFNLS